MFHQDLWNTFSANSLHDKDDLRTFWLGFHGIMSYSNFLMNWKNRTQMFRFYPNSHVSAYKQTIKFLHKNSNKQMVIATDSGGPYGRVRESLVTMALQTNRPLCGAKLTFTHSITLFSHHFPLPFSTATLKFTPIMHLGDKDISVLRDELQKEMDAI